MHDDFESLRKHVLEEGAENRARLDEIHALSEQAIDAHAMLSNGLQIVTTQSARVDEKIDALREGSYATRKAMAALHADMRWLKLLLVLMLAWQIGESVLGSRPAQALLASVVP